VLVVGTRLSILGPLAAVGALLAAGCEPGAPDESLSGTVAALMVSQPSGAERQTFVLTDASGVETELLFAALPALATGDEVRVHGRHLEATEGRGPLGLPAPFAVSDFERPSRQAIALDPGATVPLRNILIVLFNFKNDDRQYYTTQEIQQRVLTDKDSVRAFYEEQSYGLIKLTGKQNPDGDVTGWHTLDAYDIPCNTTQWANMALDAARGAGVDTTLYQHFIFYFPASPACDFSGLATIGGRFTWMNGASISTMAHEFGHSFGLLHANSYECRDKNQARVTMGDDCANVEYGNPFDLMGRGGLRHTNAYNKAVARWLTGSNIVTVEKPGGTYTLLPQEQPSNGPQLLVVPRDARRSYYLEFRQPFGFDNFAPTATAVNTAMLLLGNRLDGVDVRQSWLLDTTPTTSTLADAPLAVGKTYEDPAAGVSITLVSTGAAGAQIKVALRDPIADAGVAGDASAPDAASLPPDAAPVIAADAAPDEVTPTPAPRKGCACALGATGDPGGAWLLVLALAFARRRRRLALAVLCALGLGCSSTTAKMTVPPSDEVGVPDSAVPATVVDAAAPDAAMPADVTSARLDAAPTHLVFTVPGAPPAIADLCAQEAQTQCTQLKMCAPQSFTASYGDDATCSARVEASCRTNVQDPARHTTVDAYTACVADLGKRSCLDVYYARRPASCSPPMGNTAENGPCTNTRDCVLGLTCRLDSSGRCGSCVPALMAGDRCSLAPGECVFGTRCVRDECTADLALGAPCKRTVAGCGVGLICTDAGCAEHTGDKGAACGRADICDPTKNLYCNLTTALCDDLPAPTGKERDPCDSYADMGFPIRCMSGLYCELNMGTTGGHCRKYAAVGEACDTLRGPQCAAPAVCSRGVCKIAGIVYGNTPPTFPPACK
jgi:MYXO-CTERM domain-containing protein